ncbi:MAG: right-handed parallel beta-helix repeat-containing protein, partial [Planctomycetales bacterium]|nr:right-handed parallel beta-helix repeat-containing protein [Planctomycetales bacterium]
AARHEYLSQQLADARVSVEPDPRDANSSIVTVFGSVAVKCRVIDQATQQVASQLLYPGLAEEATTYYSAPYQRRLTVPFLEPAALRYKISAPPEALLFSNAITGVDVQVRPLDEAVSQRTCGTIHPDMLARTGLDDVEIGPGEVVISANVFVQADQTLTIHPGTQLRIAPGVGIYSRGKVLAQGTAQSPIEITGTSDEPWAAFGITGPASAGTRLSYVSARGGSIGSWDGLRFKGMINVYGCPDVKLLGCQFGLNQIGDDTVNLAESHVVVEECLWRNSLSDALDLDQCHGVVTRCRWEHSGNDGLDLMGCVVDVRDCYFEASGDKGISVGEATRASVTDCQFDGCHIGTELKDSSQAIYTRCRFEYCRVGAHAYQKKWFYSGGGRAFFDNCTFRHNEHVDLSPERRSRFVVRQTLASTTDFPDNVFQAAELNDDWAEAKLSNAQLQFRTPLPPAIEEPAP